MLGNLNFLWITSLAWYLTYIRYFYLFYLMFLSTFRNRPAFSPKGGSPLLGSPRTSSPSSSRGTPTGKQHKSSLEHIPLSARSRSDTTQQSPRSARPNHETQTFAFSELQRSASESDDTSVLSDSTVTSRSRKKTSLPDRSLRSEDVSKISTPRTSTGSVPNKARRELIPRPASLDLFNAEVNERHALSKRFDSEVTERRPIQRVSVTRGAPAIVHKNFRYQESSLSACSESVNADVDQESCTSKQMSVRTESSSAPLRPFTESISRVESLESLNSDLNEKHENLLEDTVKTKDLLLELQSLVCCFLF